MSHKFPMWNQLFFLKYNWISNTKYRDFMHFYYHFLIQHLVKFHNDTNIPILFYSYISTIHFSIIMALTWLLNNIWRLSQFQIQLEQERALVSQLQLLTCIDKEYILLKLTNVIIKLYKRINVRTIPWWWFLWIID